MGKMGGNSENGQHKEQAQSYVSQVQDETLTG
jgi:hypothetical protein